MQGVVHLKRWHSSYTCLSSFLLLHSKFRIAERGVKVKLRNNIWTAKVLNSSENTLSSLKLSLKRDGYPSDLHFAWPEMMNHDYRARVKLLRLNYETNLSEDRYNNRQLTNSTNKQWDYLYRRARNCNPLLLNNLLSSGVGQAKYFPNLRKKTTRRKHIVRMRLLFCHPSSRELEATRSNSPYNNTPSFHCDDFISNLSKTFKAIQNQWRVILITHFFIRVTFNEWVVTNLKSFDAIALQRSVKAKIMTK